MKTLNLNIDNNQDKMYLRIAQAIGDAIKNGTVLLER